MRGQPMPEKQAAVFIGVSPVLIFHRCGSEPLPVFSDEVEVEV